MSPHAPEIDPAPHECAQVGAAVAALERAAGADDSHARLDALRTQAAACQVCLARHGAALTRLEGLCALRSRAVPARALEGLGTQVLERIRARAAGEPGAGGMSLAFLDAPRSLTTWRRAALAASLLLASGLGLVASGRLAWRDPAPAGRDPELRDARDALLLRWNAPRREALSEDASPRPVVFPARGARDFWSPPVRPAALPAANDSGD